MARHYSPKNFLRQAPNALLARYCQEKGILAELDFTGLSETNIGPIYNAWDHLPSETRRLMESDFRNIDALASENGVKAIIDAALVEGEDLEPIFAEMDGFYDKSFWTFFEREPFFEMALLFVNADNLPTRYWRRRKDLPKVPANSDETSLRELGEAFSYYFRKTEGRGHACAVDYYHRNGLDYFFAYPEDYARTSIEWNRGALERRSHKPAFEIIVVYSQGEGTLDIFFHGSIKTVRDLQVIFSRVILKTEIQPEEKDKRVYDLNGLKRRDFSFLYDPDSGINSVVIKKLRLSTLGGFARRITLEADPSFDHEAIYDLMEDVVRVDGVPECHQCRKIPLSLVNVTQAAIQVVFNHNGSRRRATRTFQISYPNSCSLKQDGRDLMIRKMLVDSGLEPVEVVDQEFRLQ
jgi:hypothetical protein